MYVVGALEFERAFLAPLYKFLTLLPRATVRRVPSRVLILQYLADDGSMTPRRAPCVLALVDGFQCSTTRETIDVWSSSRFSLDIDRASWPQVYDEGDKPALITASLEASVVLVSLKLHNGEEQQPNRTQVMVVPFLTDNRGNETPLNNLTTTKFPASAVLMESAAYMKRMGFRTIAEWSPRGTWRPTHQLTARAF